MFAVFGFCFNICVATVEDKAVNTAKNADCVKTADDGVVYVCGNRESNIWGILGSPVNATGAVGGDGGDGGGSRGGVPGVCATDAAVVAYVTFCTDAAVVAYVTFWAFVRSFILF